MPSGLRNPSAVYGLPPGLADDAEAGSYTVCRPVHETHQRPIWSAVRFGRRCRSRFLYRASTYDSPKWYTVTSGLGRMQQVPYNCAVRSMKPAKAIYGLPTGLGRYAEAGSLYRVPSGL